MLANAAHDRIVLTGSLALAIAAASQSQRERAFSARPPAPRTHPLPKRRSGQTVRPPIAQLPFVACDTSSTRKAAVDLQRDALDTRDRAREMLASDHEMRTRIRALEARTAELRGRHRAGSES